MKLSRILCAVDYSVSSRQALDEALELARGRATLELVHVREPDATGGDPELEEWRNTAAAIVPAVTTHSLEGDNVIGAIAGIAERLTVDLVVAGAGRREGGLLGTVAERIVRQAPCSVLIVAGPARPPRSVLCAVDFSAPSRAALEAAADLAAERDATLTIVHAFSVGELAVPGMAAGPPLAVEARDGADKALRGWAAEAEARVGRPVTARVVEGPPSDAILVAARDAAADLIVTGTHGRTGIARAVLGSVAENVVRRTDCPVLVVRW
jgi:nucleotide-binding universal stress UspA family protein